MTADRTYNEAQLRAVRHRDGPMLVIAGPGSGKTAVITGRTCALIREGVSPSSILVVTFTRAAAAEMKERFLQMAGTASAGVTFGTFHSVFYGMLRTQYARMRVLPEEEKTVLIREILRETAQDAEQETDLPAQVIREISLYKSLGTDPEKYYPAALPQDRFRQVLDTYEERKRQAGKIDFDDIILLCRRMLTDRADIRTAWQKKFAYILVDEFQDISPMQYSVIRLLAAPQDNLFIVGDDDQSIYRFRGASPGIMLRFPQDYPAAEVVTLEENYRSSPEIISAAGRLIRHNSRRYRKQIYTGRAHGESVRLEQFANPRQECRYLAERIRRQAAEGISYRETAVLVRTNAGCREAAEQLMAYQIPFRVRENIPCLFDHWIAGDLFAYMELGRGDRSREKFLQIANRPTRYLSRQAFSEKTVSFDSLYRWYEDKAWMTERIAALEEDLEMIGSLDPGGAVRYIRRAVGYDGFLSEYAVSRGIPEEELLEIADELTESAANHKTWEQWQTFIAAYREKLRQSRRTESRDADMVTLSTLHAAKGTEYDAVYILDVNEGVIPWHRAVLDEDLEEERRMLYVGMTRARRRLLLLAVRERYEKPQELSRFIREMV